MMQDGLDWCQLGPADHSASKGFAGEWEGGDVGEETVAICDALATQGKRCGVMCRSEDDVAHRSSQGEPEPFADDASPCAAQLRQTVLWVPQGSAC